MKDCKTATKPKKRGLDMEAARKKQAELETRRPNTDFHQLKQGWNYFFILPPFGKSNVIWKEVFRHGQYVCPKETAGKNCIMCKEIARRAKKGDSDFADKHKIQSRAFFNAIEKSEIKKKDPSCVKVLGVSSKTFSEIVEYITDEDRDISDPSAAIPVGIKRKGEGLQTRYKIKFGEEMDISAYVTSKILEGLYDLDSIKAAQPASAKELAKAIRSTGSDDDGDDDNDDDVNIEDDEEIEETTEEDELLEEPSEEEAEESGEEESDEEENEDDDDLSELEEEEEESGDDEAENDDDDEVENRSTKKQKSNKADKKNVKNKSAKKKR